MGGKINDNLSFYIKLYYEFGGSSDWLKEEIIKKRFDSFKYLMPINNREKSQCYYWNTIRWKFRW